MPFEQLVSGNVDILGYGFQAIATDEPQDIGSLLFRRESVPRPPLGGFVPPAHADKGKASNVIWVLSSV